MNVIFDISVLGASTMHQSAKTGIYRVVYHLAHGLFSHKDVEIRFCSPISLQHNIKSWNFLNQDEILKDSFFYKPRSKWALTTERSLSEIDKPIKYYENKYGHYCITAKILRTVRMLINRSIPIFFLFEQDAFLKKRYLQQSDIYHSPFHPFPAFAKKVSPKTKFFLTVHDLIPIKFPQYFTGANTNTLENAIAGLSPDDSVFCVSNATRNDLLEYRPDLDPARVRVTHLAASPLFHPCTDQDNIRSVLRKYNIPTDAAYFLSLSTIEPRKNIGAVIGAFTQLLAQEKHQDLYLVLAGPLGWSYTDMIAAARLTRLLKERIIFTGFVEDQDLPALYSGAVAFVYPSFYEGFGLPPLEAMQCGVPVITSNTSSLPEVVGNAGFLVSPDDQTALSDSMNKLYGDSGLRKNLSALALVQSKKFSWGKCLSQTVQGYAESLGHRR